MKKLAFLLLFLFLLTGFACAQEALPEAVVSLLDAEYPSHQVLCRDVWGPTAAAVIQHNGKQVLCIAEDDNGDWRLTVHSATALKQDQPVSQFLLDTNDTLFWGYASDDYSRSFCARKAEGRWYCSDVVSTEFHGNGNMSEYRLTWQDDRLYYSTCLCDENDNILSRTHYTPAPASWLREQTALSVFDVSLFPMPYESYTHSWLGEDAIRHAAEELFPAYGYLGGCAKQKHLEFLLEAASGERYYAASRWDDNQFVWHSVLSSPLPKGTTYGLENFSSSLVLDGLLVNVSPVDANTYGVSYIYAHDGSDEMFQLGKNWISSDIPVWWDAQYGTHPWSDVTMIDWLSLPHTFEEALAGLDRSCWAVVHNPDPADRLHLRVQPDRSARSLGKYYNGTPVKVLGQKNGWTQVNVFGVEGWMMSQYLAFGDAMAQVERVTPYRVPREDRRDHFVYVSPDSKNLVANIQSLHSDALVLGLVGDEWYHVWLVNENLYGYILAEDWFEGNG